MGNMMAIFCAPSSDEHELRSKAAMHAAKPVHSLLKLDDPYDVEATKNAPANGFKLRARRRLVASRAAPAPDRPRAQAPRRATSRAGGGSPAPTTSSSRRSQSPGRRSWSPISASWCARTTSPVFPRTT